MPGGGSGGRTARSASPREETDIRGEPFRPPTFIRVRSYPNNAAQAMVVPLIIDTDMSIDVDDVGALCVAHALQDLGEAQILAVTHNTGLDQGVGAISVITNYYTFIIVIFLSICISNCLWNS